MAIPITKQSFITVCTVSSGLGGALAHEDVIFLNSSAAATTTFVLVAWLVPPKYILCGRCIHMAELPLKLTIQQHHSFCCG